MEIPYITKPPNLNPPILLLQWQYGAPIAKLNSHQYFWLYSMSSISINNIEHAHSILLHAALISNPKLLVYWSTPLPPTPFRELHYSHFCYQLQFAERFPI